MPLVAVLLDLLFSPLQGGECGTISPMDRPTQNTWEETVHMIIMCTLVCWSIFLQHLLAVCSVLEHSILTISHQSL